MLKTLRRWLGGSTPGEEPVPVRPPSDLQAAIETAVKRGQAQHDAALKAEAIALEHKRDEVAAQHARRVDALLARIPGLIEAAVAEGKAPGWMIEVERVDIKEMRDHNCGHATPRPGTYVEYAFRRLQRSCLRPECHYDRDGDNKPWYGMLWITIPHPVPADSQATLTVD